MSYPDRYSKRPQMSVFDQAMSQLKIDISMIEQPELIVRSGEHAHLNADASDSALSPILRQFETIDEVKEILGFSDDVVVSGQMPQPPLPQKEWTLGTDFDRDALCCGNLRNLEQAAYAYLYGDSALISDDYKAAINYYYHPFEVAVYAACNLVIEPDATLEVSGKPAFLLFDHIDIRDGGNLSVKTSFNISSNWLLTQKD